ncbi:FecR domain-containing protein [Thalassoglobus sp. JC818]|uniref:FecR domain-containing protein n=1 Tax=Thalassoglobus sp. JC818 TaxID=3232136 RepID=UPI00345AF189
MNPSFDQLWTDYLEGELDGSGLIELQEMLAADTELLKHAANLFEEHRLLGLELQPFDSDAFVQDTIRRIEDDQGTFLRSITEKLRGAEQPSERDSSLVRSTVSSKRWFSSIAIAVLTLLVSLSLQHWFGSSQVIDKTDLMSDNATRSRLANDIATLIFEDGCEWSSETALHEGQRLPPGSLELITGTAVIRFDGGAELVMTGETSLVLSSTGSAKLNHGNVVIRAEDGAEGFELATPRCPLIDLGTEFAVRVGSSGDTEVHVLDGQVEYRNGKSPDILTAGHAVRLSKTSDTAEAVELDSPRFEEVVRRANPRPQPERMQAYEGFHYEPGILPLEETTKGIGWGGPWRLRTQEERKVPDVENSPEFFEIVHGLMNVTWPVPGGRLGMLMLPPSNSFYVRPLAKPVDLGKDGVTFFSLMVRETERRTDRKRPQEHLRLTFRASEDYFSDSVSFGHGPGARPRIQAGNGNQFTSPLVLPTEQTMLWIGKIISRKEGKDEIYFRIYGEQDLLGYAEPSTWHVVTRGVDISSRLDRLLLSSTGVTARIVDELRIGPTWRSVAPMREEH